MHGEFGKQLLATARGSKHRTLAIVLILIVIAGALYYVFGGPTAQQRRANRFGTEGPVPVLVTAGPEPVEVVKPVPLPPSPPSEDFELAAQPAASERTTTPERRP